MYRSLTLLLLALPFFAFAEEDAPPENGDKTRTQIQEEEAKVRGQKKIQEAQEFWEEKQEEASLYLPEGDAKVRGEEKLNAAQEHWVEAKEKAEQVLGEEEDTVQEFSEQQFESALNQLEESKEEADKWEASQE